MRMMCALLIKCWRHPSSCLLSSLILMILLLECKAISRSPYGSGSDFSLGFITPTNIVLEEGNSLEMFCHLNLDHIEAKGHNASDLLFIRDERPVPKEFVEVVNASTVRLFEKKPPASNSVYICSLHTNGTTRGVYLTRVIVGFRPQEVVNFTCYSNNWENLTCTWTKPWNPLDTKYNLYFRLPGRGGRSWYRCSESQTEKALQKSLKSNEGLCYWDLSTEPFYRQPYEFYIFNMTANNSLGTAQFPFTKFHHYGHVIPSQPQNLTYVSATYNSILLRWSVPNGVLHFSPGLLHRVEYQSTWDRHEWHLANTSLLNKKKHEHIFNLTGLQFANTFYDIRVFTKSAVAVGNDKWSKPATLTVKTKPTRPGAAPRTDVGSFEEVLCNNLVSRDVYVYWQHIPEYLENGDNFRYKIISVKENGIHELHPIVKPDEEKRAYAKFKALTFSSYNFSIVASNSEGDSEPMHVYLPNKKNMPVEPIGVTKIAYSSSLYELSWKYPPEKEHLIQSYTIFWCNNVRDRPYQCPGFLNWTHVPRNETVKNITVPVNEIYQFAVSANTKYGSSGMVWASCTVIHNKSTGKMKSVWINRVGSDFIEVGWKFECSDRIGRVEKFFITYCPIILSGNDSMCKENETFIETSPTQIHNNITGLRPYTTYRVSVAVETHSGVQQRSDLLYQTTLEGAPEPPRNVSVSDVTNTSMVVTWIPPLLKNGVIILYKVCYGDPPYCIEVDSNNNTSDFFKSDHFSWKVENLTSYKKYKVFVEACTQKCSGPSEPILVHTLIGMPGIIERPKIRFINSSQREISWKRPQNPGGLLNLYQVAVHQTNGETNRTNYYNSTANRTQIPVCDADEIVNEKYLIMVRALNEDQQGRFYYGPWSESTEYSCLGPSLSKPLRTAIVVVGVLLVTGLVILLLYVGKRIWLCCKEMQDLVPKLPPGLAPTFEKEKDPDFHIEVAWPSHIHDHQVTGKPLLDDSDVQHVSTSCGDSSGCSSGHESVSSSLTAGTHISSDSGTEADQRPRSPDGVFLNTPWDGTSLRQRNINALRPVGESYVKMGKGSGSIVRSTPNLVDADSVSLGTAGPAYSCLGTWSLLGYGSDEVDDSGGGDGIGYCRVGLDATALQDINNRQDQVLPSKGYVVLSNLSASTPQLLPQTGQLDTSPQTHGYVAHHIPSPLKVNDTDKGYVMAGEHGKTTSTPPEEFDNEDHGFLDLESLDDDDESYSQFGLQPIHPSDELVIEEHQVAKPSSGYVTLGDSSHSPDRPVINETSGATRTFGASGGYVPHRHFEKRDASTQDSNLLGDCMDESYSSVVSLSAGDSSSKVNV